MACITSAWSSGGHALKKMHSVCSLLVALEGKGQRGTGDEVNPFRVYPCSDTGGRDHIISYKILIKTTMAADECVLNNSMVKNCFRFLLLFF